MNLDMRWKSENDVVQSRRNIFGQRLNNVGLRNHKDLCDAEISQSLSSPLLARRYP